MRVMESALKALERFLKIDTAYVARGSFWLILGKAIGTIIALALSMLYARFLLKDAYGDYRYVLSVLGLLGVFALPGMGVAIRRAVSRGYDYAFIRGARIILFSSFGITLSGILIGSYLFWQGNAVLGAAFVIASFIAPFNESLSVWRGFFEGKMKFRKKTYYNIWAHVIYGLSMMSAMVAIIVWKLPHAQSMILLISTYFLSHAIPSAIFYRKTVRLISKESVDDPESIRYGLKLSALYVPQTASNYLDAIILYNLLGSSALAVYSFAIAIPEQMKAFLSTVQTVVFPKLSLKTNDRHTTQELKKTLPGKALKASILTGVLVVIYILAAPVLFRVLFPKYMESVLFSQIFTLSLIPFPFGVFNAALKAEGNMKKIYAYNTAVPFIQILALLVLIPSYGIWGAVGGRIIGRFANYFLPFLLFKK
ncbi:MAG: hypothetical protein A3C80_00475 [Candidatus Ryanbacteria bacterium RIFCSPHIGHO2_02_FULL_45_43]|uniref:Polysaccharide biosynthesis protein C-terminal domain-containing protein n=1 Tax=Candidatus Ryanbacteria bacterium RIFCSPHIGHO2_01_45_13 TaxID=1802112 RepID=A0A1G2FYS0_9BACT|nr:MAG: hypothetical protein A2718_01865 [Candidatus Ryanbacteria bacterium RIFCSPHIGHO2_01_FULL_44_130]OGZ42721.1 MAG: hypothetical protein A2W41_03200 [Candidatus Ryanbacteria bacterium RIFCSPHIGHO2_01_45_13]OGZ48791.1 MAG: hypothetical protein A3C80_00475 [Candidatus Ryanbacteria bacterium RIFCSPHIGHO2_02_FULL_45_43]OGZ50823.1 MAG: hypothetical protein A3E55_02495 [Candidatus Ryanbacteria bacterium RIFCSPHIGHO2_12_FULL_44_20]OGZ52034.1 MAG: hypothetical protein A3A17_01080 [Candidatus Ryanba